MERANWIAGPAVPTSCGPAITTVNGRCLPPSEGSGGRCAPEPFGARHEHDPEADRDGDEEPEDSELRT